jgi:hypothetical protein
MRSAGVVQRSPLAGLTRAVWQVGADLIRSALVYERQRRYRKEGFFDVILQRLQVKLNEQGLIDFDLWQVDSTTIRAHKSAAGAGLKRGPNPMSRSPRIMR